MFIESLMVMFVVLVHMVAVENGANITDSEVLLTILKSRYTLSRYILTLTNFNQETDYSKNLERFRVFCSWYLLFTVLEQVSAEKKNSFVLGSGGVDKHDRLYAPKVLLLPRMDAGTGGESCEYAFL